MITRTVIVASGSTSLDLDCSTSKGITGADNDTITTCKDSKDSRSIDGKQTAKKTLPSFSLVTAYPVHGGCTFDSVISPTFYQRGLYFKTNQFSASDPNNATLASFTCGLTGPGFADYFFYGDQPLSGSGISTVYNCSYFYDGKPAADHWPCTFEFDPFKKSLDLDKEWQCDDKDSAHP